MQTLRNRPLVFSLDRVLGPDECTEWIAWAEDRGFHRGALISRAGVTYDARIRNNERMVADDRSRAGMLFSRLRPHLPHLRGWAPTGCNERLRIYRYRPGQRFRTHRDAAFERQDGERSRLTLLVYLNEEFEGGETWFPDLSVSARTGRALLFEHNQPHAGVVVEEGTKYVARSDIMYFPDFSQ